MKPVFAPIIASFGLLLASASTLAQPPAAASAPMSAASKQQDCSAKHDHGAERGMPSGKTTKCANSPDGAASAPAKKKVEPHDHGKFHKGQG